MVPEDGGLICPGIGCGPMGVCSGIEKKATICNISAMKTMIIPTKIMVSAAPIKYNSPAVWKDPRFSLVAIVS